MVVSSWIAERTRDEVIAKFDAAGLGVGSINTILDVASDPHIAFRSLFSANDPLFGSCRFP